MWIVEVGKSDDKPEYCIDDLKVDNNYNNDITCKWQTRQFYGELNIYLVLRFVVRIIPPLLAENDSFVELLRCILK